MACVYYEETGSALTTCNYETQDASFSLAPARLNVVVRQATTGRTVEEFPLRSDPSQVPDPQEERRLKLEYRKDSIDVHETEGTHTWRVQPPRADLRAGLRPLAEARL